MFAQESAEPVAFLLTITHPQLATPILLSSDATTRISDEPVYATISRSLTFLYAACGLQIPDEQDGAAPAAKLVIENVTREVISLARSVSTPPQVKMEVVLVSAPDTVEITWPAFDMTGLQYDGSTLQFDLTIDALTTEPYPSGTFGPADFPALLF